MDKSSDLKESQIRRVSGRLHRVQPILDAAGKVIHYAVSPLRVELRKRDLMQILAGSAILAVPIAFTEETWNLGETLPIQNVIMLGVISIVFIATYVYFNFYKDLFHKYISQFIKRVLAIYFLSLLIVGLILSLIQVAPWTTDFMLAIKRIIIVGFPASMSATISDAID